MALTVEAASAAGVWLRHIPAGRDPRGRPPVVPDGRWQRGTVAGALYLASDEDGMWAEWYRHLAEAGIPPLRGLPRDVWRFDVTADRVADLSTAERLDAAGLAVPPPGRRSWERYQRVGEQLHAEGWAGLIAPSAARPADSRVLCLFTGPGDAFPESAVPHPPPSTVDEPPAVPTGMRT